MTSTVVVLHHGKIQATTSPPFRFCLAQSFVSTQSTVARGTALLSVYSAGLAVPFLLVAPGTSQFLSLYQRWRTHRVWVERFAGGLLIVVGGVVFFEPCYLAR